MANEKRFEEEEIVGLDDLGKKKSHKDLFDKLEAMSSDEYETDGGFNLSSYLPSSLFDDKKKKKVKEDKSEYDNPEYSADEWFNTLMTSSHIKMKKGKLKGKLFEKSGLKKKKKKKKDGNLVDYKKELSNEMALYKNLLMEQTSFTEALQQEYDRIMGSKGSHRGVNKQITDLMDNITRARTLAMQLVEKNVNTKKLIAELTMKQKKEMGGAESDNMVDFASSYLRQMMNERQALMNGGYGNNTIEDYSDDDFASELTNSLNTQEDQMEEEAMKLGISFEKRDPEADLYLKYENRNVTTYIVIHGNDIDNFDFVTKDEDGVVIPDYPEPLRTKISINRSTNIATDTYGKHFPIIWD